jgi:hypothetical protein
VIRRDEAAAQGRVGGVSVTAFTLGYLIFQQPLGGSQGESNCRD